MKRLERRSNVRDSTSLAPLRETVEHVVREIQPKPKSWEDYEAAKARIYRAVEGDPAQYCAGIRILTEIMDM